MIVNIWNLLRIPVRKLQFDAEFKNGYTENVLFRGWKIHFKPPDQKSYGRAR